MSQCSSKTRKGERCHANAGPNGKCAMHSSKNRARDLAQRSAAARREAREKARNSLLTKSPETPEDLIRQLATTFAELANGRVDENRARALASVANVILKGFELIDVKKQLAEIERQLKERT